MAVFSENQVRQLYVAKARQATASALATVGDVAVGYDTAKTKMWFTHKGVGGNVRSDMIKTSNIVSVIPTDAAKMSKVLKKKLVALDANVNSGAPLSGQDYILNIFFRNYIGMSEEDQYMKWGAVHATATMTAAQFYDALYTSLKKNFSRDDSVAGLVTFSKQKAVTVTDEYTLTADLPGYDTIKYTLSISAGAAAVTKSVSGTTVTYAIALTAAAKTVGDLIATLAASSYAGEIKAAAAGAGTAATTISAAVSSAATLTTYNGICIIELEQYWKLGTFPQVGVFFDPKPTTITVSNDQVIWGTVTDQTYTSSIANGKKTADLEYFLMGERGDYYRNVGFPKVLNTTYLVDPTVDYNFIDVTYFYQGANEDVQKSQKTITLVVPKSGSFTVVNAIIDDIETATGLTIAGLS